MKRRHVMALGGAAAGFSGRSWAQPASLPRIGYLSGRPYDTDAHLLQAFREGLKGAGYVDGQNVVVDVRWADGRYDRAPALAAEMVAAKPRVIAAVGGNPVAVAVKAATSTIPVVFTAGADPVQLGLLADRARPNGNLTGVLLWAPELDAKRLVLLRELLPKARTVAILTNPSNPAVTQEMQAIQATAARLGMTAEIRNAASSGDIERAFESLPGSADALVVVTDAFLINRRRRITELASVRRLPTIYPTREFVDEGGLASYGPRWPEMYGMVGRYAGRLLGGTTPADLPVWQPTSYELVINQRTAKTLDLTLSPAVLGQASEVLG